MRPLRPVVLKQAIIYGPVTSRRLGRSLGINVLGSGRKICTFDCVYCQLRQPRAYDLPADGQSQPCKPACVQCRYAHPSELPPGEENGHLLPAVEEILDAVADAVRQNPDLDSLTLSGNGEPTAYPAFAELARGLAGLRDNLCPGVPVTLLSNASLLWRPDVRRGLAYIDRPVFKLDAGDEATFRRVDRPCPHTTLDRVLEGLASQKYYVLQTMLVDGASGNASDEQVERWLERVERLRPSAVQLYSLDRVPADGAVLPVPVARLEEIAGRLVARTGFAVKVY